MMPELQIFRKLTAPWRDDYTASTRKLVSKPWRIEIDGELWGFAATGHLIVFFQAPGAEGFTEVPEGAAPNIAKYFHREPVLPVSTTAGQVRTFAGRPVFPADIYEWNRQVWHPDRVVVCRVPLNRNLLAQVLAPLPDEVDVRIGGNVRSVVLHADGYRAVVMGLEGDAVGPHWPAPDVLVAVPA